ncbi:uncharacterized protein LOC110113190 isoform X2 [Dendrobium catenatum]|uniref:N-acetyltransferase domain-containing protein n=1 Tax=Dendrobium catenatum TaxID=906689 RepID=A0A2I0VBT2_9ASPA|nr:uncharacterized protein LOC110113190 isoform X2 [Dendrobium catenatum]PKU60846.1 hypothetical protein MA16_Dca015390 [Dendrobium catenatum]
MAAATGLKAATRFFFHSPGDLLCQICNESSQQRRNPRLRTKRSKAAHLSVAGGEYLVEEFGWGVRRMTVSGDEMRKVADVQAEAFHVPVSFFNDVFFEFFKAEVLSALMYRIRNSPSDRYACLVAESIRAPVLLPETVEGIAGVVDCTVQSDEDVLRHLQGAEEYLYVSGIAVRSKFRRQKVGTVLLKACDALSQLWGHDYIALRAYEDDLAAKKLYSKAGFKIVSIDPHWITWIGKKKRILMVKSFVL